MQVSREPAPAPAPDDAKAERRRRLLASNLTELAIEFRTDKWGVHKYTLTTSGTSSTCGASPSPCSSWASAATRSVAAAVPR